MDKYEDNEYIHDNALNPAKGIMIGLMLGLLLWILLLSIYFYVLK